MSQSIEYLHYATSAVGILGVLVIIFGVLSGGVRFVRSELLSARGMNVAPERRRLRQMLGFYLLLGLEFLIAADIIDTLMRPNPRDLLVLGTIVAIRTVISYSLNAELAQDAKHGEKALNV
jgi:uncharacterized membrane protein